MLGKRRLEEGARVGARWKIAAVPERGCFKPGPFRVDSASGHRAAQEKRHARRAVIGAACTIGGDGAAEFAGGNDSGLVPNLSQSSLQGGQAFVERSQATLELTLAGAL